MIDIRVLGEQTVREDGAGGTQTWSLRVVELLALLLTHPGAAQPRQHIAELFWPDSTDRQALTNLRRELHDLRRALGQLDLVEVSAAGLSWRDDPRCRADVSAFLAEHDAAVAAAAVGDHERVLRHGLLALDAYGGPLLPASTQEWVLTERADLEARCVTVCDLVCRTQSRAGEPGAAVPVARRRVALRPLEEVGYRTLMELYAGLGDRAAAVSTYHHCATVLERELDIAPDPATQTLLRRVVGEPDGRRGAPPIAGAGSPGTTPRSVPMVGRGAELDRLAGWWRTAASGRPTVVLVRGGPGVGKTRLLAHLAERVRRQGAVVARSRCFGTGERSTLAPIADWLRHPEVAAATAALDPAWRHEVDRLVPRHHTAADASAGPRALVDAWQRHRFVEGMARALLSIERPLLLILDDLQWCDHETLAFLTFLVGFRPTAPLLLAATLRDDGEVEPQLTAWRRQLGAGAATADIALEPLDLSDTGRLAAAVGGRVLPAADQELLHATTGGFPLFVVEAAHTLRELGCDRLPAQELATVLSDRLAQADEPAREVAGLAAAVGTNVGLDLLTEASDLAPDVVVRAVDELWRRRILREFNGGYDFSHDLLRAAAYAQVSPARRWLLHRRIAQALELLHPDDADAVAVQLAEQYRRGGRPDRSVANYRRAADLAAQLFAHSEAIRLHDQSLEIIANLPVGLHRDRQELAVLEAISAPLNARHGYSSVRLQHVLERSVALADQLGRRESLLLALVGLWTSRFVQGRTQDGYRVATRALQLAAPGSVAAGVSHFAVGGSALSLGRVDEGLEHLALAARLTDGTHSLTVGTRPDVHATAWAAHGHWLLGDAPQAARSSADAVALARTIEHPYSLAVALAYRGVTVQLLDDRSALRATVTELEALCERFGFAYYREWSLVLRGWLEAGSEGLAAARAGVEQLRSAGSLARMPYWLALVADLLDGAGQPGAAAATLDAAVVTARAHDDVWWLPEVLRRRAAYDPPGAAAERLREAAELARQHGSLALLRRCERDLDPDLAARPAVDGVREVR
ncbi:MAG: ATP-binding protein [Propionibacteriaceae bacterium]